MRPLSDVLRRHYHGPILPMDAPRPSDRQIALRFAVRVGLLAALFATATLVLAALP